MPEIPEIRAHAERLETLAAGEVLKRVEPLSFTALKTASPSPDDAVGWPLRSVGQRAKFLLLRFAPPASDPAADGLTFVVHLMQGGRLRVLEPGAKRPRRPRDGLARFEFESGLGLMLTEPGTQKRAGVWVLAGDPTADGLVAGRAPESADTASIAAANPLAGLGPEASERVGGCYRCCIGALRCPSRDQAICGRVARQHPHAGPLLRARLGEHQAQPTLELEAGQPVAGPARSLRTRFQHPQPAALHEVHHERQPIGRGVARWGSEPQQQELGPLAHAAQRPADGVIG